MKNTIEEPIAKPIDETAQRLGTSMRVAREYCRLSIDELAGILRVMPTELYEYECGIRQIPTDILQRIFIMGYKMMYARRCDRRYIKLRQLMCKASRTVAAANKAE